MDFDILPQLIIVFSIAGILVIVAKNFSKVKEATRVEIFLEESSKEKEEKEKFLYLYQRAVRRINKENYQKKIAGFWVWFEKFLRKLRIIVLKLDTRMASMLERLRQKNVQSIENWKKMAEKNMHKGQGADVLSGVMGEVPIRNRRKLWGKAPKQVVEPDETVDIAAVGFELPSDETVIADGMHSVKDETDEPSEIDLDAADDVPRAMSGYAEEAVVSIDENADRESALMAVESVVVEGVEAVSAPMEADKVGHEEPLSTVEDEKETIIARETADAEEPTSAEEELKRTKKEQECIEILMQDPANIKAYWKLGLIYSKRRNYEDALACFRQIVKIDPTYTKAKQKAIELMEKMKNRGK